MPQAQKGFNLKCEVNRNSRAQSDEKTQMSDTLFQTTKTLKGFLRGQIHEEKTIKN